MQRTLQEQMMKPTTSENWTEPGSDSFNQSAFDTAPEGACVYCGDYDPEFRKHFMTHYGVNGGEYGHYAAAYELGHRYAHDHEESDWSGAERPLRAEWEHRGQGSWDDFK